MLQKLVVLIFMMFVAAFAAGVYGVLHNQLSYSLSQEYFTKFKFFQFGIPWALEKPRLGAACVGFLASWWMGSLICLILGGFSFSLNEPKAMALSLAKSFIIVMLVAFITGIVGLIYGYYAVNEQTIDAYTFLLKDGVSEPVQFVRVGFMHNSSYIGGGIGLFAGIIYLLVSKHHLKLR